MKRILITGASRGIGRAIATKLAGPDTALLLHGRDPEAMAETQRAVEASGARASTIFCDLGEPARIDQLVSQLGPEPLDALINNAGIAFVKPFDETSLAEWQRVFAVNVTAPFLLVQKLHQQMSRGSTIVNILSIAARTGFPNWSGYCMSKFALEGFSQSLREELRPRGIRVVNVYPAATNTEIWNSVEGDFPREKMMLPDEIGDAVAYVLSRPNDVAIENLYLSGMAGRL